MSSASELAAAQGLQADFAAMRRLRSGHGDPKPKDLLALSPEFRSRALGTAGSTEAELDDALTSLWELVDAAPADEAARLRMAFNFNSEYGDQPWTRRVVQFCELQGGNETQVRKTVDFDLLQLLLRTRNLPHDSPPGSVDHEGITPSVIALSSSAIYHRRIVALEEKAKRIDYVQYRVSPFFLSDAAVEAVATMRFGRGNPLRADYIHTQRLRRNAFTTLVERGVAVRELYPRDRLRQYVMDGTHSPNLWPLPPDHVVDMLQSWRKVILKHDNYIVAVTDQSVPIKYHVIDGSTVAIHEPIGRGDAHRLCAVLFDDPACSAAFMSDFDLIWDLTDATWRDADLVADWIETELIPLALQRTHRDLVQTEGQG